MQTERVTFLTSPDHKAALDAYAAQAGQSVGHVVREATNQFISQPSPDEEVELTALMEHVNEAIPKMNASIDRMIATMDATHRRVDAVLREMGMRP